MKTPLFAFLVVILIGAWNLSAQPTSLPAWTSNDNRTILARFAGIGGHSVLIEKDGQIFNVPFTRLSAQSVAQARRMGGLTYPQIPVKPAPTRTASIASSPNDVRQPAVATGLRRLPSHPEWAFLRAYQDGSDIVVYHATATVFGHDTSLGVKDPNDNGRCASGRGTKDNPGLLGCALPVSLARRSTLGSPFARLTGLPWFSQVVVTHKDRSVTVQLIDNGPSVPAGGDKIPAGIDLTPAACAALGIPLEDLRENRAAFPVSFRLRGAGRLVAMN